MIVDPSSAPRVARACDLFCRVVDNYGDAGVCWRLARQLAHEHGWRVRLVVDDLATLARLAPRVDAWASLQTVDGVDVRLWTDADPPRDPAEIVVEAFACELPRPYRAAMRGRTRAWLNLEYLSAEPWVETCHALPSLQPEVGVDKHFFFPGFTARTGGVIRERDLAARRALFEADPDARARVAAALGAPAPARGRLAVLLFCYPTPALTGLVAAASALGPADAWIPPGEAREAMAAHRPGIALAPIPFVPQHDFDEVLWACDAAVVRGEDSFVRAQLAARPFVWHVYPQADDAHLAKLEAFADRYTEHLAERPARAWRTLNLRWNIGAADADDWAAFADALPALRDHAVRWADRLGAMPDLASNLASFVVGRL